MANEILIESIAEIRNSNICMIKIVKDFAHQIINEIQFSLQIAKEVERQRIWLSLLEKEEHL